MKRTSTLTVAFILSLFTLNAAVGGDRPNILYLYVDDMGWGAIGPNGQFERKAQGLPHLITPNLDRLAREGVNFARSYGATVCSPARSSQQTGFHQGHTFADRNDPDNAKKAIRTDDLTMGDVLSKAGYVTGYWGKWGYGGSANKDPYPEILNIQTLPTSHGYEHVVAELHHVRAHTFFQPTLWKAPASPGARGGLELVPNSMSRFANNKLYPETPALQSHKKYPEIAYCDDVYSFAALDFIRVQAQNYNTTGQPFFGLLAAQVPHAPFDEVEQLPEWDKAYRGMPWWGDLSDMAKQWAAMITRIDGHFGNLLAALEDPNGDGDTSDSVADKTLIVFQSDNGGPGNEGSRVEFAANGVLSGQKGRIQEGGIRVPTLMRLPKAFSSRSRLKPGTTSDKVIDVTDLLPTFSELAGVDAPLGIDGVSIAPTLTGKGHQRSREFLIHEAGNGQSIIRGKMKLVRSKDKLTLFDLKADPGESTDVAGSRKALVKTMKDLLIAERATEPKGFANTYHHWIGGSGRAILDAGNWSDYIYENEGIRYMTDDGGPSDSWIARIESSERTDTTVVVDSNVDFLGLGVRGGQGRQTVVVQRGAVLGGRNEIRVGDNASLRLQGGSLTSMRWVNIDEGGALEGSGEVVAEVINEGELAPASRAGSALKITGDYWETDGSSLVVTLRDSKATALEVGGVALLSGALKVVVDGSFPKASGTQRTILSSAHAIAGRFSNEGGEVVAEDGTRFRIRYRNTSVSLEAL